MGNTAPPRAPPQAGELLHAAETALVQHRAFGDSRYIRGQLAVTYRRRLRKLGAAMPAAQQLAALLDADAQDAGKSGSATRQQQFIGDIVLRCAIQHAMRQVIKGDTYGLPLTECAALFDAASAHWRAGLPGGPLTAGMPAATRLHDSINTQVWQQEEGPLTRHALPPYPAAFLAVIEHNYGAPLATPTQDDMAMLRQGWNLLDSLLPRLAHSALEHVQLVALYAPEGSWRGKASSSQFRVNGCIFLNRGLIGNPWWLAEHLLHEALHQKLYDFRHGHSLLGPGYEREDAPAVCSLWNAPDDMRSNYWDAHRTLAAFHVYVQLALLCLLAEQREDALAPRYGPISSRMSGSRRAIDRARYLGEQLHAVTWPELGLAGRQMTDWLVDVLDVLDVQPRPAGASLHLLLDLYQRQSRKLEVFLSKGAPSESPLIEQQAKAEAQAALAALQAGGHAQALETLQAQLQAGNAADWPHTRRIVLQALNNMEDSAGNAASEIGKEMIREMVQQSSRQLAALGALG
ncbi:aKG-HExxH-type peptide beta-hydroxylase [Janthinobacterium sp. Mn2066]|uniref:aKG-HExxH-type peptide beta-hydroxylase n=1 Tax=Janthinobacterium sp. Mn2066 TaxID=3395264 RepID=UPI003BE1F2CD